jgi:hypothetical protein
MVTHLDSSAETRLTHPMTMRSLLYALLAGLAAIMLATGAKATSNYKYKLNEYVVVNQGRSPDGRYSIATHGDGEDGYEHFHVYLMDAQKGKTIGPLEEIVETLDTGADAFNARWSGDSRQVAISYRADRHVMMTIRYRIENSRAYRISGPKPCPPTESGCHF